VQEKYNETKEEEKSPGAVTRVTALNKFQSLSAGCKESGDSKEERITNYEEFGKINANWCSQHFNVPDTELLAATQLILSIYE